MDSEKLIRIATELVRVALEDHRKPAAWANTWNKYEYDKVLKKNPRPKKKTKKTKKKKTTKKKTTKKKTTKKKAPAKKKKRSRK